MYICKSHGVELAGSYIGYESQQLDRPGIDSPAARWQLFFSKLKIHGLTLYVNTRDQKKLDYSYFFFYKNNYKKIKEMKFVKNE